MVWGKVHEEVCFRRHRRPCFAHLAGSGPACHHRDVPPSRDLAFDNTMTAPPGRLSPRERAATQHTMAATAPADAPPAFATGSMVAGRYFVKKGLGRGGMGEVYEAQDVALGENVALKCLRLGLSGVSIDQFRQEAQLARRVTHVNVCRIHDIGHHEGVDFLSMELLEGETLSARLDRVGRLAPDEALAVLAQLCAGVHAAHEAGIVHRDLKCGNVMIVPGARGERVVITDFGLALVVGVEPGNIAGSPAYMAPEQVTGGFVGPAADIYALGVIMFEMLTGKLPFVGDTAEQTARKRLDTPPPSPRTLQPGIDARWERAILRCLSREPSDRFPDAPSLLAAVKAPTRRPARWAAAVMAIALGGAGAVVAASRGDEQLPGANAAAAAEKVVVAAPPPSPPSPPGPGPGPMAVPSLPVAPVPPVPPVPQAAAEAWAEVQAQAEAAAEQAREVVAAARERREEERQRREEERQVHEEQRAEAEREHHDARHAAEDRAVERVLSRGVRRVGPGKVEVGAEAIEAISDDPNVLLGSAAISPALQDGKMTGFMLQGIRRGTLLSRLGFRDGDIVTSIDGVSLSSPDEARSIFSRLGQRAPVRIGFLRKGKPKELELRFVLPE